MSKIRVHKNGNFTVMSNYHFREKKMSLKSKGLLSLMLSLPDNWNYSVSGLVTLSKDGKDSVMSALAELEEFGYLARERVTNSKGQFAGIEYNIYEEPQKEKPIAENPMEANANEGKAPAENPSLLNTYTIKELNNKIYELLNTKDEELLMLYKEYIITRVNLKAPLTEKGLESLVKRAKRLSKGDRRVEKIILEASIRNNWKDIYLPKEEEIQFIKREHIDTMRAFYGLE